MSVSAKSVKTQKLSSAATVCSASTFSPIRGDSAAIEAMTDFARISAATVGQDASLEQTNATMIARGVRLLLVTTATGEIAGLISARDLMGEKPTQVAQAKGLRVPEVRVADLMCPVADIDTVDLEAVLRAKVNDIVETLRQLGRQHLLVQDVDPSTGGPRVRGIFSATQIGRQLGAPVQGFDLARTFAEIESALAA
jgi:CBS domain-containing protein